MKVIRWPELDVIESDLKVVDEFWYKTDKGPIIMGAIFPLSQESKLKELKNKIEAKKKELNSIEAEIYKISRDFKL
jgi:folate-dependent phosphoribosylglycinamide formyltransferase PurN